jgi:hypothetical protein
MKRTSLPLPLFFCGAYVAVLKVVHKLGSLTCSRDCPNTRPNRIDELLPWKWQNQQLTAQAA